MSNIDEKISALFDGELSNEEADEVLEILQSNKNLQAKLSKYALISSAFAQDSNNLHSISSKQNRFKYDFWFSNIVTAAATVLITFFAVNQFDFNRMGEDLSAKNQINIAINSKEARDIVNKTDEDLIDHVMHVINNPEVDEVTPKNIDLRNVGYQKLRPNSRQFNRGNKSFILRVEKKNLGIKNIKNWRYGNKMIYVVPLSDGRVVTLYGNIDANSAIEIANSIQ